MFMISAEEHELLEAAKAIRKYDLATFSFLHAKLVTIVDIDGLPDIAKKHVMACLKVLSHRMAHDSTWWVPLRRVTPGSTP